MTKNEEIQKLIDEELAEANEKFPPFHSLHEAYAVILEEVDETKMDINQLDILMGALWEDVKGNIGDTECIERIAFMAQHAVAELIQVAAMCQKAMDSFYEKMECEK